jgi:transglutaminase-like putative cysteine protease
VRYRLGCSLSYEIGSDCTFIFNLEAAKTARQAILNEALVFTPPVEPRVFADPSTDNRYVVVNVVPGGLSLEYNADVELSAQRADPATISETPIGELPLEVFPYLLPSRYVPSDRLASFAQAEFGSLAPGNKRVSEICSWIYDHLQYHQ